MSLHPKISRGKVWCYECGRTGEDTIALAKQATVLVLILEPGIVTKSQQLQELAAARESGAAIVVFRQERFQEPSGFLNGCWIVHEETFSESFPGPQRLSAAIDRALKILESDPT